MRVGIIGWLMGCSVVGAVILSSNNHPHDNIDTQLQDSLIRRVWELDSIIINHTYGPLTTRYEYGASEKDYNRKWHITSDSLYALRRRAQNEFDAYNANQ